MLEIIKKQLKKAGIVYLAVAALFLVIGLGLLLIPYDTLTASLRLLGILLLASGIFTVIFGVTDGKKPQFWVIGILMILLGLMFSLKPDFFQRNLTIFMGAAISFASMVDLFHYLKYRYTYGEPEIGPITISALSLVLGVVILLAPFGRGRSLVLLTALTSLLRAVLSFFYYRRVLEME